MENHSLSAVRTSLFSSNTDTVLAPLLPSRPLPVTLLFAGSDWLRFSQLTPPTRPFIFSSKGTGNVGTDLAKRLVDAGATVYTSDAASHRADIAGCTNVSGADWKKLDVDVFSPNGPAGIIDAQAVDEMSCRAIVGAANVPFKTEADKEAASAKGEAQTRDG